MLLTVVSSYLFSWEICLHSTVSTLRRAAFYWTLTAASVGQPRHRNSLGLTFMVIWVSHPMGWFRPHAFLKRKEHVFPGRVTAETSFLAASLGQWEVCFPSLQSSCSLQVFWLCAGVPFPMHPLSKPEVSLWFPRWCGVKNLPAMQETRVWSLSWEDPLEEGMATYSSILAWRIP